MKHLTKAYFTGIAVLLLLGACQNNVGETKSAETPVDADTVALVDLGDVDTAAMARFSVDSLTMVNRFQDAANEFTTGYKLKDAAVYAKYLHPSIVKANGGLEKFMGKLKGFMKSDTAKIEKMISGPVKRVEAAIDPKGKVTGWYCLMPVRRWVKGSKSNDVQVQWLAGQSIDGQKIYFLDITGIPKERIYQVMPDFHFLLDKELAQ